MSEEAEVLIPAKTGLDVLVLAAALPLAVVTLGCCLYFLIFPDSVPGSDGIRLPFLSRSASDVAVICGALTGLTVWLCARGFGALWRVLDRRPMLVANADGLIFHPAVCTKVVPWREVRCIHSVGWYDPYDLGIELRRRIWAVETPLSAQRIRIGGLYVDNNGFVSSELISRLDELRRTVETGAADLKACRDPDAGG
jgi:hypothetical protein